MKQKGLNVTVEGDNVNRCYGQVMTVNWESKEEWKDGR